MDGPGRICHQSWGKGAQTRFLFATAKEMMREAGIQPRDLGLVGVGRGPGSFTGVRMAVIAAKTLAEVLGLPLVAPDSLAVVAAGSAPGGNVFAAVDARRGELYYALFRLEEGEEVMFPRLLEGPLVSVPEEAVRFLEGWMGRLDGELVLAGTGIEAYPEIWPEGLRRAERTGPDPQALAGLCRELYRRGWTEDPLLLRPSYLRHPDVGKARDG